MSFLGMGPFEIIIILLVAFIFLGPERMADAARTLGKWTSELRRATAGVRAEMDDLIADDPTRPTPPAQPNTTRPTQTRPANADARPPDETHPNAPIEPSAPTAADATDDEIAPNAAADSDTPVPFRSARANPTPPDAPPKPPSDAAPTPDAPPNRAPTEDNP